MIALKLGKRVGVERSPDQKKREGMLFRTSSIEDVQKACLVIDGDLLAVAVLNSRIVLVYEVVLDELNSQGRLSDTSAACAFAFG